MSFFTHCDGSLLASLLTWFLSCVEVCVFPLEDCIRHILHATWTETCCRLACSAVLGDAVCSNFVACCELHVWLQSGVSQCMDGQLLTS